MGTRSFIVVAAADLDSISLRSAISSCYYFPVVGSLFGRGAHIITTLTAFFESVVVATFLLIVGMKSGEARVTRLCVIKVGRGIIVGGTEEGRVGRIISKCSKRGRRGVQAAVVVRRVDT